jgi:hypothetical protein
LFIDYVSFPAEDSFPNTARDRSARIKQRKTACAARCHQYNLSAIVDESLTQGGFELMFQERAGERFQNRGANHGAAARACPAIAVSARNISKNNAAARDWFARYRAGAFIQGFVNRRRDRGRTHALE